MPIVLIALGAILADIGIRGTEHDFGKQLESDFGGGNFISWAALIVGLGSLGYSRRLAPLSTAALILLVVVMVVVQGRRGVFADLSRNFRFAPSPAPAQPLPNVASGGSGGGGGGILGDIGTAADIASVFAG